VTRAAPRRAALATAGAVIGAAAGLFEAAHAEPEAVREAVLAEEAPVVLDRWLVDAGRVRRRFRGEVVGQRPIILSFTYSACGATCPISDLVMGAAEDLLARSGRRDVLLATLTLDPLTDTPERLRAHAARVGAGPLRRFYTGNPADVFAVLDGLGIRFGPIEDHATFFLVFDARGRLVRRLPLGAGPEDLLAAADKAP
jgi:protein SCO1/2